MKSANTHNWKKISWHLQTEVMDTEAEVFCRVRPQDKVGCQAHGEPSVLQDLKLQLTSGNSFTLSGCQGDTASCPHCPDSWDIAAAHQSVSEPPWFLMWHFEASCHSLPQDPHSELQQISQRDMVLLRAVASPVILVFQDCSRITALWCRKTSVELGLTP